MIGPGGTGNKISVELDSQGTVLDDLKTESLDQGTTLDSIETNQTDGTQKAQIVDSEGDCVCIDEATCSIVNIEVEHHEVHEGDHYFIANFETVNENGNIDFIVIAPDTTDEIHMTWGINATSQTEFRVYEGSTASDDGALITPVNNNRRSANASIAVVRKNPTIGNVGTLKYAQSHGKVGATPAATGQAGIEKREREIILKRNTKYLFRTTSKDDGNIISYFGEWYENGSQ